jgi:aminocarboxymuconate-semialdehyde decarboxylase
VIWNPLETTIALSHLIFEGTLDAFRDSRFARHMEVDTCPRHEPIRSRLRLSPTRHPASRRSTRPEYLKQMYFDSLVFTPEALRHLVAEVGSGKSLSGPTIRSHGSTIPLATS